MARAVVGAVAALLLTFFAGGSAMAAAGPSGTATAENVVASLTLGSTVTEIGTDRAASVWGAKPSAEARMDFLTAGAARLGGGSRMATTPSESGSEVLGPGAKTIDGLASATITAASVEALIDDGSAHSSAEVTMADLSMLGGLVEAGTAQTTTESTVTTSAAEVSRTLTIGDVRVLSIRRLLQQLGIDPAALTCAGVEAAGAELGVATAGTCAILTSATNAVAAIQSRLASSAATLSDDLATAQGTVAGLSVITQPLADLAAVYGVNLGGPLGTLLGSGGRDALIAEIDERLTAVDGGASEAAAGTCQAAGEAATGVVASVPSMAGALAPLQATLSTTCAILQSLLDDLLGTSLLQIDTITVGLGATAAPDVPLAEGTGTIGVISVGNRSLTVAGITSLSGGLQQAIATAQDETADALTALGLGAFPTPTIEILDVESSAGRDHVETWFADVTVTGLRVVIPPVPISLPSGASLASVLGTAPASAPGPAQAGAPVANSPQIVVNAAVFSGRARYNATGPVDPLPSPSSGSGTKGTPLAKTGGELHWIATGLLLLVAGATLNAATRLR